MNIREAVRPRAFQFPLWQLLLLVTAAGGLFLVWRSVLLTELSAAERLVVLAFGSAAYVHFAGLAWLVRAVRGRRISSEVTAAVLMSGTLCAIQLGACALLVLAQSVDLPAPLKGGLLLAFAASSFGLYAMLVHSLRHKRYRLGAVQGALLAFAMAIVVWLCVAGVFPGRGRVIPARRSTCRLLPASGASVADQAAAARHSHRRCRST